MSAAREVLGHIDCPSCGTDKGMRITHDKNGEPFGYCEAECSQQLRIGGDLRRVRKFVARYPWAAKPGADTGGPSAAAPVTETKPAPKPVTVTAPKAPAKPVPVTVPAAKPKAAGVFDFLLTPKGST
jgi:hypothetical protein